MQENLEKVQGGQFLLDFLFILKNLKIFYLIMTFLGVFQRQRRQICHLLYTNAVFTLGRTCRKPSSRRPTLMYFLVQNTRRNWTIYCNWNRFLPSKFYFRFLFLRKSEKSRWVSYSLSKTHEGIGRFIATGTDFCQVSSHQLGIK